ncbi:MAG: DinB family protein [Saprospiraceae bacterium]
MKFQFEVLRVTRNNILKQLEGLSDEQLNVIPDGFNNNIIWNVAHVVATSQLLIYGLSGVEFTIPKSIIDANRKGSKPDAPYSAELIQQIKTLAVSTVDQLEKDYNAGLFKEKAFKKYPTSYGITLENPENAITFNNVHESMHFETVKLLKRSL